ncbi:MAG: DEAD/DEAH box helicase [Deltaproteobacteria bacterium]|nr:DEAD/DEAH box helicase [Deltaproteobacteria bacterium]
MNFESFNLNTKINAGVKSLGFTVPTPIQEQAIPPILEGCDVMGLAQTGTGKTAAFVLPILQRLMAGPRKSVRSLIIAPTRELTEQTNTAIKRLGGKTGLRGMSIYGGVSIRPQISTLQKGVDIVSACPGRLLDHINRGTIDVSNVEVLVLDEADQMFDMGFLPDIKKIIKRLPAERQTLLFSATMPKDIRRLATDVLQDPVKVQIGHTAPAETVAHTFYAVTMRKKIDLLHKLLNSTSTGSVLVFTRTKMRSKRVAQQLEKSGYEATALHGNLSQNKRQQALDGFRKGRHKILVATDVAARGIDVRAVSHVINYDMPDTVDAYTHRIGRTGRACETGDAFTFVTSEDKELLHGIEKVLGANVKLCKLEGFYGPEPESDVPKSKPKQRSGGYRSTPDKNTKPRRRTRPKSNRRFSQARPRPAAA